MKKETQPWGYAELKRLRLLQDAVSLEVKNIGRVVSGGREWNYLGHWMGTATSPPLAQEASNRDVSSPHGAGIQVVVMESTGGPLARPRKDGVFIMSKRQDAANRKGGKTKTQMWCWATANNPKTFEKKKRHKREIPTPRNGIVYSHRSRVNRANRIRIWHVYN